MKYKTHAEPFRPLIAPVLCEAKKLETIVCRCKKCKNQFDYDVDLALMERVGLKNYFPNICEKCESDEVKTYKPETRASSLAATIPFQKWSDLKGNMKTLNAVATAIRQHQGVIVLGDTGRCKTRALCVQALDHIHAGLVVRWRESQRIGESFSQLEHQSPEKLEAYKRSFCLAGGVLCIDDLGKGKLTEHRQACWFDTFNRLLTSGKTHVWITTNKTPDQLAMWLGDYGRTTVSRISQLCTLVDV